jgi:hypothetical protein
MNSSSVVVPIGTVFLFRRFPEMNMTETPDAFALNQNPMRLLLHALEEPGIQTLAKLGQRTRLQHRIRDERLKAAEGLLIHVLPNQLHQLPVTQTRQVLQQDQTKEQLGVRLRPIQTGKMRVALPLQLPSGNQVRDLQPAVVFFQLTAKREQFLPDSQ